MASAPKSVWRRALSWAGMALAMAGVVWLYQRPEMLVMLSEQLWACF